MPDSSRRRWWLLALAGLAVVVIAGLVSLAVLQRVVDTDFAERMLAERIEEASDGALTLELETLRYSVLGGWIEAETVRLVPTDSVEVPVRYEVTVRHARAEGVGRIGLVMGRALEASSLRLDSAGVRITFTGAESDDDTREGESDEDEMPIRIGHFVIERGDLTLAHALSGDTHRFERVAAEAEGIDSARPGPARLLAADDVRARITRIEGTAARGAYRYTSARATASTRDSTLHAAEVRFEAEDPNAVRGALAPIRLATDSLALDGADWLALALRGEYLVGTAELLGGDIALFLGQGDGGEGEPPVVRVRRFEARDGRLALHQPSGDTHRAEGVALTVERFDTTDDDAPLVYARTARLDADRFEGTTGGGLGRYTAQRVRADSDAGTVRAEAIRHTPTVSDAAYVRRARQPAVRLDATTLALDGLDVRALTQRGALHLDEVTLDRLDLAVLTHGGGGEADGLDARIGRLTLRDGRVTVQDGSRRIGADGLSLRVTALDTRRAGRLAEAIHAQAAALRLATPEVAVRTGPLAASTPDGSVRLGGFTARLDGPTQADIEGGPLTVSGLDDRGLDRGAIRFREALLDGFDVRLAFAERTFSGPPVEPDEEDTDEPDENDQTEADPTDLPTPDRDHADLLEALRAALPDLRFETLTLRDGALRAHDLEGDTLRVEAVALTLREADARRDRPVEAATLEWSALRGTLDVQRYDLRTGPMRLATADSSLTLAALHFVPTVPDSVISERGTVVGFPLRIDSLHLNVVGLDAEAFARQRDLRARLVRLDSLDADVYVDRNYTEEAPAPFPHEMAQAAPIRFAMDSVRVEGRLRYRERAPDRAEPGVVDLAAFDLRLARVANDSARVEHPMTASFRARLADDGPLTVEATYDLFAPELDLRYTGSLERMDLTRLNDVTKPLAGVEIESGRVDSLRWDLRAQGERRFEGMVYTFYRDLEIALVDADDGSQSVWDEVLSFLANNLAVRSGNTPDDDPDGREVDYEAPIEEPFIDALLNAIMDGVASQIVWLL